MAGFAALVAFMAFALDFAFTAVFALRIFVALGFSRARFALCFGRHGCFAPDSVCLSLTRLPLPIPYVLPHGLLLILIKFLGCIDRVIDPYDHGALKARNQIQANFHAVTVLQNLTFNIEARLINCN